MSTEAGSDRKVRVWSTGGEWNEVAADDSHGAAVKTMTFIRGGRWLVTGDEDGNAFLWDLASDGRLDRKAALPSADGALLASAISPDLQFVTLGGSRQNVSVWKVDSGMPYTSVPHDPGGIASLAFDPRSRWLATASAYDATVRLWDMEADNPASEARIFRGLTNVWFLLSVMFDAQGDRLIGVGSDGTVLLWRTDVGDLLDLASQRLGRDFDERELERYFPGESRRPTLRHPLSVPQIILR